MLLYCMRQRLINTVHSVNKCMCIPCVLEMHKTKYTIPITLHVVCTCALATLFFSEVATGSSA